MTINGNTENTDKPTVTPYADTAYKGKANPYFRKNIAPPEQRSRHLAKGQCQMGVFPRVKITGICWDNRRKLGDHLGLKDSVQDVDKMLNLSIEHYFTIDKNVLETGPFPEVMKVYLDPEDKQVNRLEVW